MKQILIRRRRNLPDSATCVECGAVDENYNAAHGDTVSIMVGEKHTDIERDDYIERRIVGPICRACMYHSRAA